MLLLLLLFVTNFHIYHVAWLSFEICPILQNCLSTLSMTLWLLQLVVLFGLIAIQN